MRIAATSGPFLLHIAYTPKLPVMYFLFIFAAGRPDMSSSIGHARIHRKHALAAMRCSAWLGQIIQMCRVFNAINMMIILLVRAASERCVLRFLWPDPTFEMKVCWRICRTAKQYLIIISLHHPLNIDSSSRSASLGFGWIS